MDECYNGVKDLNLSIFNFDYFESFYSSYTEFLDSLTSYKIVCIFIIIIDGLILLSFEFKE